MTSADLMTSVMMMLASDSPISDPAASSSCLFQQRCAGPSRYAPLPSSSSLLFPESSPFWYGSSSATTAYPGLSSTASPTTPSSCSPFLTSHTGSSFSDMSCPSPAGFPGSTFFGDHATTLGGLEAATCLRSSGGDVIFSAAGPGDSAYASLSSSSSSCSSSTSGSDQQVSSAAAAWLEAGGGGGGGGRTQQFPAVQHQHQASLIGAPAVPQFVGAAATAGGGGVKPSANMTECVAVPSSEHVAEIVGRQGNAHTVRQMSEL